MPVTREHETIIKKDIKMVMKKIIKHYSLFLKYLETKNNKYLNDIFIYKEKIDKIIDKIFDLSIETFAYAPLGKDLRRNISYSMITKSLRDLLNTSINIAKFLTHTPTEIKYQKKWVGIITESIIKRIKEVDKLMTSEDPIKANEIIDEDLLHEKVYLKQIKLLREKIVNSDIQISQKVRAELLTYFMHAIKSFENANDYIKDIAEISLFISTGKLK